MYFSVMKLLKLWPQNDKPFFYLEGFTCSLFDEHLTGDTVACCEKSHWILTLSLVFK